MVFSSPTFLYLFLPVFLALYYALPARARVGWILIGSWAFYALWRPDFLALLAAVTLFDWGAGFLVDPRRAGTGAARAGAAGAGAAKAALVVSVVVNLAVLGYFKYFNFGVDTLNAILERCGWPTLRAAEVILPVGISFYIFQAMSYVVDVYRDDAPRSESFVDMAAYIALFPQLVAGPIIRYKDLAGQLRRPDPAPDGVAYGLRRFAVGLCRKVLIADTVAPIAAAAFSMAEPSAVDAWLGVLAYSIQLYFDFSGYSDMAVGLGRMMGFSFMENFDAPYRATGIGDFWRRWHISLSTWLRDYLYIPLGGNRGGPARTYLNLALVMAIGGLWHGASWNFVAWGCWHGLWLGVERFITGRTKRAEGDRATRRRRLSPPAAAVATAIRWAACQLVVAAGWVVFRAPDMAGAGRMFAAMLGKGGAIASAWTPSADMAWRFGRLEGLALAAGILYVALERRAADRAYGTPAPSLSGARRALGSAAVAAGAVAALAAAVIKLSADGYSPFLYFQF